MCWEGELWVVSEDEWVCGVNSCCVWEGIEFIVVDGDCLVSRIVPCDLNSLPVLLFCTGFEGPRSESGGIREIDEAFSFELVL